MTPAEIIAADRRLVLLLDQSLGAIWRATITHRGAEVAAGLARDPGVAAAKPA